MAGVEAKAKLKKNADFLEGRRHDMATYCQDDDADMEWKLTDACTMLIFACTFQRKLTGF